MLSFEYHRFRDVIDMLSGLFSKIHWAKKKSYPAKVSAIDELLYVIIKKSFKVQLLLFVKM